MNATFLPRDIIAKYGNSCDDSVHVVALVSPDKNELIVLNFTVAFITNFLAIPFDKNNSNRFSLLKLFEKERITLQFTAYRITTFPLTLQPLRSYHLLRPLVMPVSGKRKL